MCSNKLINLNVSLVMMTFRTFIVYNLYVDYKTEKIFFLIMYLSLFIGNTVVCRSLEL